MSLRIKLIQKLIEINENLIFYPRLSRYYKAHLCKQPLIFDVGSNKGQSIDFFKTIRPDSVIYGFEPNISLFKRLKLIYDKHGEGLKLFNIGISNITGHLVFRETITDETSTFEDLNYDSDYLRMKARVLGVKITDVVSKEYEVEVKMLRDIISENNVRHIDVLKIDTEGHELRCLEGLFPCDETKIDIIQIEHHQDDMYQNAPSGEKIEAYLLKNGYKLVKKINHGFGDFEEWLFRQI